MRHGACDAQGNGRTTQEAPGFGVGSLAGKSERHTFHIKLAAHQAPNAPPVVCNFGTGGSGLGFFLGGSCGPHVGHCCLSGSKVVLLFASDHLLVVEIWAAYTEQGGGGRGRSSRGIHEQRISVISGAPLGGRRPGTMGIGWHSCSSDLLSGARGGGSWAGGLVCGEISIFQIGAGFPPHCR